MAEIYIEDLDYFVAKRLDQSKFVRSGRRRLIRFPVNTDVLVSKTEDLTKIKEPGIFHLLPLQKDENFIYWCCALSYGPVDDEGKANVLVLKAGKMDHEFNPLALEV